MTVSEKRQVFKGEGQVGPGPLFIAVEFEEVAVHPGFDVGDNNG